MKKPVGDIVKYIYGLSGENQRSI